jgi:hypothetical protein
MGAERIAPCGQMLVRRTPVSRCDPLRPRVKAAGA